MNQMTALLRRLVFAFLVFIISSISFADDLSFSQAWSVLQENNDGLAAAYANQEKSVHMVEAAKDLYWPEISISADYTKLDDEISIAVEDNGPGIAVEDKNKIFDRFFQSKKHAGPGYRGTGLGLAISKELVELHGGRIEMTSEAGCGTTFTVFLPLILECAQIN